MSESAREKKIEETDLHFLFQPRSVAVVGAARESEKVGRVVFDNLLRTFSGPVYPVNPKAAEIAGRRAYSSITDIGSPVDLIVIAIPAPYIKSVFEEGSRAGARAAVVISAGFKETGVDGARLETELAATARSLGIRLVGPNCLGVMDTASGLNASFAGALPRPGGVAFMSQSGALCTAILDWAQGEDVGFSKFISLGNKADITEVDLLPWLAADAQTKVISMYIEGITDGRAFMSAAAAAAREKPVVALKSGTTNAGAKAVSSHTGTLAGSESVYEAAFRQSGVIRAASVQDLFDYALGFSYQPIPRGRRLAVITNAGGPGIMAADESERRGLWLANFDSATIEKLRGALPAEASVYNPVDVLGDALADRYGAAIKTILADPNVDSAVVILTPQAMTEIGATAAEMTRAAAGTDEKPVFAAFMGKALADEGTVVLRAGSIPNFYFPERAVAMVDAMVRYSEARSRPERTPARLPVDREAVSGLLGRAIEEKKRYLVDIEALDVVKAYGIRTPRSAIAQNKREALEMAAEIGYPVVLKVSSPDVLHKTDVGAVKVGVENDFELRRDYRDLLTNVERYMPEAEIEGVVVQEMVRGGKETIIGMNRDPQFGPLMMFGMGGIYVEVLKDVAFRLAPVTPEDAAEMLKEIRSRALLEGVRGEERADIEAVIDAIIRLSQLVMDEPSIAELDINPLMAMGAGAGAIAADVRILLEAKP